jgi:hypothetical protein
MRRPFVILIALTALGGLRPGRVSAQGDRKSEAAVLQRALDDITDFSQVALLPSPSGPRFEDNPKARAGRLSEALQRIG